MACIPEGRNHPVDYSKSVLIGGSCEVEDQPFNPVYCEAVKNEQDQ